MILYNASTDKQTPPDAGKYIRLGIIAIIGIIILVVIGNQGVILSMNFSEFDEEFSKPLYYSIISALILSSIALIRVNIVKRSSIFWYSITTAIGLLNRSPRDQTSNVKNFSEYRLSVPQFVLWQLTKILLFGAFFVNIMFGLATSSLFNGSDLGIENLPNIFSLPFVTPPTDSVYAVNNLVPIMPALLLLIPPVLAAIGLRLVLYVGIHNILNVVTSYIQDSANGKPRYLNYVSIIEAVIGLGVIWAGFNLFFTEQIDYNSRYLIGGILLIGFILIAFSVVDKIRSKVLTHMLKRDVYIRIGTIIAIAIIIGGLMSVNNSIADARKIEFLGPYTAQQIGINRYLGQLDQVQHNTHDVKLQSVSANNIKSYVNQNQDILKVIRIWDWEAAFAKLKPEIGLIPYVDFEDNDILRFNNTLYWTASMKPILPASVSLENRWYNEHLVYTHVPNGFLTLEATNGQIIDSATFFKQREIYYGEGGLFGETWSAYPLERGNTSAELGGTFYRGTGGLDVSPPLSWVFEPNFLLSFPNQAVHVMRYKDVHERMQTLYPYFLYDLFGKTIDLLPVTDGKNTYWLVPLIVGLDTKDVPWSMGNPYLRLVGYGLIDTTNGNITLVKTGDDFFTDMFEKEYGYKFEPMPSWLHEQIRYPVELFNWKTEMYNIYHVTDVETFIQANEFYEIPNGLSTYYVQAKPPGFEKPSFLGLLSLELRGSQGRNLAGYMIVENDLPNLGKMQFYEVPLNSTTKLIGPTAVREALDKDTDFAQLKTLLRNPRIGDNILYRVGDQDVYFIPVYTAGAGGVVAQLGTIAAVGAAFNGEYYVGLGETQDKAFEAYLKKLSGIPSSVPSVNGTSEKSKSDRIDYLKSIFKEKGLETVQPTSIQIPLSFKEGDVFYYSEQDKDGVNEFISKFIDNFVLPRAERVFVWEENNSINFGTIFTKDGILEMHYVSIEVGN